MPFTVTVGNFGNALFEWTGLTSNGAGSSAISGHHPDKTVQVDGTVDTATIDIEGSNDGSSWFTLSDPQGSALTFTATGISVVAESPQFIRPNVSSVGASTDVNVRINAVARD